MLRTWLLLASLALNSIGIGFAVGWVAIPAIAGAVSVLHPDHGVQRAPQSYGRAVRASADPLPISLPGARRPRHAASP
jgi:hypothetical protein